MIIATRLRRIRQPLMLVHDAFVLVVAYLVFTTIRYGSTTSPEIWADVAVVASIAVVLHWILGAITHVYRDRYLVASLEEMVALGLTALAAGALTGTINAFLADSISRAVPLAATCAALFVMFFSRVLWRHFWDRTEVRAAGPTHQAQRTLVYGAGYGGRQLIRSMRTTADSAYLPVGLLDDDRQKRNLSLHGVRVLGGLADLPRAAEKSGATALVIAIPSASSDLIRSASEAARELGIDVKVLPGVSDLFQRPITIRDVRDIDVADLLGRTRIETDIAAVAGYLTGKRVLVTGAGGSIGSELARQIHKWGPAELMMLDR
ncbi:MAG: polysaccharide biosynthesis protein, partial [Nocardioides sp.]|nr:polysaccharide biosynthesis protein [Nocardioides sp.]